VMDLIIGAYILLSGVNGWRTGLIRQIVSLIAVIAAWLIAKSFSSLLVPFVEGWFPVPEMAPDNPLRLIPGLDIAAGLHGAVAFVLLFVVSFVGIKFLGSLLDWIAKLPGLSILNRLGGVFLGLLLAVLISGILVNVLVLLPYDGLQRALQDSPLAQVLLQKFQFFSPPVQSV
jgi:uncharacterized membrane protein required for colicin V production